MTASPTQTAPFVTPPDPRRPGPDPEAEGPGFSFGDMARHLVPPAVTGASPEYDKIASESSLVGRLAAALPATQRHSADLGLTFMEYSPIGDVKDVIAGITGRDPVFGVEYTEPWMRALAIAPLIGPGFGLMRSLHKLDAAQQMQHLLRGTRRGEPMLTEVFGAPAKGGPRLQVGDDIPEFNVADGLNHMSRNFSEVRGARSFEEAALATATPTIVGHYVPLADSPHRAAIMEATSHKLVAETNHGLPENRAQHPDEYSHRLTAAKTEFTKMASTIERGGILPDRLSGRSNTKVNGATSDMVEDLYALWDEWSDGSMEVGSQRAAEFTDWMVRWAKATEHIALIDWEMDLTPYLSFQDIKVDLARNFSLTLAYRTESFDGKMGSAQQATLAEKGLKEASGTQKGKKFLWTPRKLMLNDRSPDPSTRSGVKYVSGPVAEWGLGARTARDEFVQSAKPGDTKFFDGLGNEDGVELKLVEKTDGSRSLMSVPGQSNSAKRTAKRVRALTGVRRGDRYRVAEGAQPSTPAEWYSLEADFTRRMVTNLYMARWWNSASDIERKGLMDPKWEWARYRQVLEEATRAADGQLENTAGLFAALTNSADLEGATMPALRQMMDKPGENQLTPHIDPEKAAQGSVQLPVGGTPDAPQFAQIRGKDLQTAQQYVDNPAMIGTEPTEQFLGREAPRLREWLASAKPGDEFATRPHPNAGLDASEEIAFKVNKEGVLELLRGNTLVGEKLRNASSNALSRGYDPNTGTVLKGYEDMVEVEEALRTGTMDTHEYWAMLGFRYPGDPPQFSNRSAYVVMNNAHANVVRMFPDEVPTVKELQSIVWNWWQEIGGEAGGSVLDDGVLRVFQRQVDDPSWAAVRENMSEAGVRYFNPGHLNATKMRRSVFVRSDHEGNVSVVAPKQKRGPLVGMYPVDSAPVEMMNETWHLWAPTRPRVVKNLTDEGANLIDGARSDAGSGLTGYSLYNNDEALKLAAMHGTRRLKISIPSDLAEGRVSELLLMLERNGLTPSGPNNRGHFQITTTPNHLGVSTAYKDPTAESLLSAGFFSELDERIVYEAAVRMKGGELLRNADGAYGMVTPEGLRFGADGEVVALSSEWSDDVADGARTMYDDSLAGGEDYLWNDPPEEFQRLIYQLSELPEDKMAVWIMPRDSGVRDRIMELMFSPLRDHADSVKIDVDTWVPRWAKNKTDLSEHMYDIPSNINSDTPDARGWRVKDWLGEEEALDMVYYPADLSDGDFLNDWLEGSGLHREMRQVNETWAVDGSGGAMNTMIEKVNEGDPHSQAVFVANDFYQMVEGGTSEHLGGVLSGAPDRQGGFLWGSEVEIPREANDFADEIYGSPNERGQVVLEVEEARHALDVELVFRDPEDILVEGGTPKMKRFKPTHVAVVIPGSYLEGGPANVTQVAYDQDRAIDFFLSQGVPRDNIVEMKLTRRGGRGTAVRRVDVSSTNVVAGELARKALVRTGVPDYVKWNFET